MGEAMTAIEALGAILNTGANGAICILGYTVLKHELRINRLEGRSEK